ncbi:disulfide bond formation protein B [Microvirga antarctica]|uniref:disulfide bond formation protein B n=1 Tax=Microvirga antarctica TaxID=2819233 RepID=UPI001B30733E|nr:disulfide bond formation protein B [Microvirga antarctica]
MLTPRHAVTLNALGLYAIAAILFAAFVFQIVLSELPCPLCLLQRVAFAALAVGPALNVRFGPRPSHYAVSLVAALAGAGVSGRQILLHVLPGDAGYGSAILGYHYYTWAFVIFVIAIVLIALVLLFDRQFEQAFDTRQLPVLGRFEKTAFWLVFALVAGNILNVFVECGPDVCPDNPTAYLMLP